MTNELNDKIQNPQESSKFDLEKIKTLIKKPAFAFGASMFIAIASLIPWMSIGGISVAGIDGDGRYTFIAGIIAGAVIYYYAYTKRTFNHKNCIWSSIIFGIIVVLLALNYWNQISTVSLSSIEGIEISDEIARDFYRAFVPNVNFGLPLTILGGLGLSLNGLLRLQKKKK